jgi:molybdate/tungstate transport system substrate-binding protein
MLVVALAACSPAGDRPAGAAPDTLVVYEAASLSAPMRPLLDSFARRTGTVVHEEHGGSLELARRVTELHHRPDVVALADQEVFPQLLVPGVTAWYARFARNRMVIAYTERSRAASEISAANWWRVLQRPDVRVGRTDPRTAPAGYRTLLLFRLAEWHYAQPGLAARLEASAPSRLMRGNAAELAALLDAGELDYIVDYESLARAHRFPFVQLPAEIDLGDPAQAASYGRASVRVARGRDSVTITGAPILYGVSVPRGAPHPAAAGRFLRFMMGDEGRAMLRKGNVDVLPRPELVGDSIPPHLRALGEP